MVFVIFLCLFYGIAFVGLSFWLILGHHLLFKARLQMIFSALFVLAFVLPPFYRRIVRLEFAFTEIIILLILLISVVYLVELMIPRNYWILPHLKGGGAHLIIANVGKETLREAVRNALDRLDRSCDEESNRLGLPGDDMLISITGTLIQQAITFRDKTTYEPIQEEVVIPEFETRLREQLKKKEPTWLLKSILGYPAFAGFYLGMAYVLYILTFLSLMK